MFGQLTLTRNNMASLSAVAYGSTSARSYPVSLVLSGRYLWQDGKVYYQGSYGDLSSSMSYASWPVNLLAGRVSLGDLLTQNDINKVYSFPLRCVNKFVLTNTYPIEYNIIIFGNTRPPQSLIGGYFLKIQFMKPISHKLKIRTGNCSHFFIQS